jgi:hypothetical protein
MTGHTRRMIRTGIAAAAMLVTFAGATEVGAAGPGLSHYSVHTDDVVVEHESADNNACYLDAVITMRRHINASLATTQSGLTDAELVDLLAEDPNGILRQVAMVAHGDVTIEMGGVVYTGTFTQRFDGRFLTNGMYLQSGSIAATLRSTDGDLLTVHGMGHDVDDFDGTTKHAFSRGRIQGDCP